MSLCMHVAVVCIFNVVIVVVVVVVVVVVLVLVVLVVVTFRIFMRSNLQFVDLCCSFQCIFRLFCFPQVM